MDVDFASLRQWMVEEQIMARGILQNDIVASMRKVPRHLFVPPELQHMAYDDGPLPIGEDQIIECPYKVAAMVQAAEIRCDSQVLEIGTGSGYQAAVLGELAREVYTVEKIPTLAKKAQAVLQNLGYQNVHVRLADSTLTRISHKISIEDEQNGGSDSLSIGREHYLTDKARAIEGEDDLTDCSDSSRVCEKSGLGLSEHAPYDVIILTEASFSFPKSLEKQLAEGGRLIISIGNLASQRLIRYRKVGEKMYSDEILLAVHKVND